MAEATRNFEKLNATPVIGAIPLDSLDLRELSLRRIASLYMGRGDKFMGHGGMSFSKSFLREKQLEEKLINPLVEAGRAKVVDRPGKGAYPGAGNSVVYLTDDESVQASLNEVAPEILQQASNFFYRNPQTVKSVNIFPNTSPNALKGVSVEIARNSMTGATLSQLNWTMGRGTRLIALPSFVDAETFIETEDSIAAYARAVGGGTDGAVKSIKFYYDEETYRVYMALAAGPTDHQKKLIRQQLNHAPKAADIQQVRKMANRIGVQSRDLLTQALMEIFPWRDDVEVLLDEPYIDFDTDHEAIAAYSGGIKGAGNGVSVYTIGLRDMIVYDSKGEVIVPMGTKVVSDCRNNFSSAQNVKSKPFRSNSGMIPAARTDVQNTLENPTNLKALSLVYHDGMVISEPQTV